MKLRLHESIKNLVPYKPGKPVSETQREYGLDKIVKLASNENPLGVSKKVKQVLMAELENLHRYPDPSFFELTTAVCKKWNLKKDMLSFANGSDEILDHLMNFLCEPGEKVVIPKTSFIAYEVSAKTFRLEVVTSKVDEAAYKFDLNDVLVKAKADSKIRMVYIANPNNPTGSYQPERDLRSFCAEAAKIANFYVVIDEAYNEFVRAADFATAMHWPIELPNVIVIKTFSKAYSLAGLRLGMIHAAPEVIEVFNRVRKPFNVNWLAQKAAIAAIDDQEFLRQSQEVTWTGLDYFYKKLSELKLRYIRSEGNFVFFDSERDAQQLNVNLLKQGLILRPLLNYGFPTQFRMSVGTAAENEFAIDALAKGLQQVEVK